jgi:hypothetical protein
MLCIRDDKAYANIICLDLLLRLWILFTKTSFQALFITLPTFMDIRIIQYLHDKIAQNKTGSPKELAEQLRLSERSIYNYILFMKNEMGAPIQFDRQKNSYVYTEACTFVLSHSPKNAQDLSRR